MKITTPASSASGTEKSIQHFVSMVAEPQAPKVQSAQLQAYNAIANRNTAPIQRQSNQGGLPQQLQSGIESLSGIAMDDVRVHYNSSKPAQLQAHAYAQGTDIHIAPGQEKHLAHEAWHVVQQKQGRVKPTLQLKGVAINDDSALETEADVMGARATGAGGSPQSIVRGKTEATSITHQRMTVQRAVEEVKRDGGGTYFISTEMKARLGQSSEFPSRETATTADEYYKGFRAAVDEKSFAWGQQIDQGNHVTLPKGFEGGACYGFAEVGLRNRHLPNDALLASLITVSGCLFCKTRFPSEEVLDAQTAHHLLAESVKDDKEYKALDAKLEVSKQKQAAAQRKVDGLKPVIEKAMAQQKAMAAVSSASASSSAADTTPLLDSKEEQAIDINEIVTQITTARAELDASNKELIALSQQLDQYISKLLLLTEGTLGKNTGMKEVGDTEISTDNLATDAQISAFIRSQADGGIMITLRGGASAMANHAVSISFHGGNLTVVDADTGVIRTTKEDAKEILANFANGYKATWPKARIQFLMEDHTKQ